MVRLTYSKHILHNMPPSGSFSVSDEIDNFASTSSQLDQNACLTTATFPLACGLQPKTCSTSILSHGCGFLARIPQILIRNASLSQRNVTTPFCNPISVQISQKNKKTSCSTESGQGLAPEMQTYTCSSVHQKEGHGVPHLLGQVSHGVSGSACFGLNHSNLRPGRELFGAAGVAVTPTAATAHRHLAPKGSHKDGVERQPHTDKALKGSHKDGAEEPHTLAPKGSHRDNHAALTPKLNTSSMIIMMSECQGNPHNCYTSGWIVQSEVGCPKGHSAANHSDSIKQVWAQHP